MENYIELVKKLPLDRKDKNAKKFFFKISVNVSVWNELEKVDQNNHRINSVLTE